MKLNIYKVYKYLLKRQIQDKKNKKVYINMYILFHPQLCYIVKITYLNFFSRSDLCNA